MAIVPISLGTRSNPARQPQAGNARLINVSSEEAGGEGKTGWVLYGVPGLSAFGAPLNDGPIRGMIEVGGLLYVVSGRDVYIVTSGGAATRIGGIPTDGPIWLARNRKVPPQIGIVSGGFAHVVDTLANTVTQISDPDLPAPVALAFLNGYGIYPIENGEFFISQIDDFSVVDGLDSSTAEAYPDPLIGAAVLEQELILFGTQSLEFFTDTGAADFPLTRVHATEIGCLSATSIAKVDTPSRKTVIFACTDHTVRLINGYSTEVISNPEIEQLIKNLHEAGNIAQLRGFGFATSGRFAYCLTCDAWTRIWSPKSGWYERASYLSPRWRVGSAVAFGTKMICGDYESGQLYVLGDDVYDEVGEPLIAEVITPHVHAFPFNMTVNALYIDAGRGVGLNSDEDYIANPKIMVSYSRDSGATWSSERERNLGALGQRAKRVQPIYRLGRIGQHGLQFRFRISSPVQRLLMDVKLDVEQLGA